ncbi:hypothetical protein [Rhodoplanes roseus]|nr:hypothetical protein [Rhodoplanes roseus]
MTQSLAEIVMGAMPVMALALSVVLLPLAIEPPADPRAVRQPAPKRRP